MRDENTNKEHEKKIRQDLFHRKETHMMKKRVNKEANKEKNNESVWDGVKNRTQLRSKMY